MLETLDQWVEGSAYERFMGRWSRKLAPAFLQWLQPPPAADWLEVGCGTGALTSAIVAESAPASVVACDSSESLLDYAREHVRDDRVRFVLASVPDLPERDGGYTSVTSMLALNYFPDPAAAVQRMIELTAGPDCLVSACVWDYGENMQMLHYFWKAAAAVDHRAREFDEGHRFGHYRPATLDPLFRGPGLRGIRCEPLRMHTVFAGFDDYWQALLHGTGPAPTFLASLDEDQRAEVARRLQKHLPGRTLTRITLTARAWAIQGTTH